MPLPDPSMYSDWRLWAKAANLEASRTARIEDNWIGEQAPVTSFSNNWTTDPDDPFGYTVLKNGMVSLSGSVLCTGAHTSFWQIATLPKAAWPAKGHNYGAVPLIMTEVQGWFVATGTYQTFPLFIRNDGVILGLFAIIGGTTVAHFVGITYNGERPR